MFWFTAAEVPSYGLALYLGVHFKTVNVSGEPGRVLLFTLESSESRERKCEGTREHLLKGTPPMMQFLQPVSTSQHPSQLRTQCYTDKCIDRLVTRDPVPLRSTS